MKKWGSNLNFVFGGLLVIAFSKGVAVGAVVTVGKPERFLRRRFQTACGNPQEEVAEGDLYRFPQLWPFP